MNRLSVLGVSERRGGTADRLVVCGFAPTALLRSSRQLRQRDREDALGTVVGQLVVDVVHLDDDLASASRVPALGVTDEVIRAGHGGVLAGTHAHGVQVAAPEHLVLVVEARGDGERHGSDVVAILVVDPRVVAGVPTGPRGCADVGNRRLIAAENVAEGALEEVLQVGARHQLAWVCQLEELGVVVELAGFGGVHVRVRAVARCRCRCPGGCRVGTLVGCPASEEDGDDEECPGDAEGPLVIHEARSVKK